MYYVWCDTGPFYDMYIGAQMLKKFYTRNLLITHFFNTAYS